MARKYALINNNIVTKVEDMEEAAYRDAAKLNQLVIDINDMLPQPTVGYALTGNALVPVTPPVIDATYIKNNKVKPIKAFTDDLIATIIAENIVMGISQAGKSGAVLDMAVRKVAVASTPNPVSLIETFMNLTLTVSIEVLDYHIDHIEDYADLAPFVTTERLTQTKNNIQLFLGVPTT